MKTNEYKILVLSDLGKASENELKNAASLASMIDGEISLFHVKNPADVVKRDNQLSAVRTINSTYVSTEKQIEALIKPISEKYKTKIQGTFTVGNVKEEINKHIKTYNPDIIVLGQRKKSFRLIGDSIRQHVLKNFDGTVIIASQEQVLEPNQELSLGMLNDFGTPLKLNLAEELLDKTNQPLKFFKVAKDGNAQTTETVPANKKVVEYVFEQGDNVINNMSRYLSKSKVDVLLLDREAKQNNFAKNALNKFNVPLVLTGKTQFKLQ
ncbi:MAG TPA: universal stress protein [Flavobacteriaceae bacterium]|nr:universal stress protein [Flavobacteriaceae bacterium]